MAMTVTAYGSDVRTISTYPQWFVWDVAGELLEGTTPDTEEIALITCPIGTILIDATVCCIVAGAGTGDDVLSLKTDDGSTEALVFTGTADNGGAVDVIDRAVDVAGSDFPTTAVLNIEALRSIDDDVTTPASYRVAMLLCRTIRP